MINEKDLRESRSEINEKLRSDLASARKTISEYRKDHGVLEHFFEQVVEAIDALEPYEKAIIRKAKRASSPVSVVAQCNDWHMGAVQPASEIEGFNSFSPDVCTARAIEYATKLIEWVDLHRYAYTADELVIPVLGDMISGDIHDELRITNAYPAPVQAVEAGSLLARFVQILAPHFKKVRVEFVVEDNHARLTKKPQAREAGLNSMNYVVGFVAKEKLAAHKNVTFNMYPVYEACINVQGRRYLCCHGHGVMGWGGHPYYGIDRKVSKEALKRMNAPDITKFHKILMGHWHTPATLQWYWIGGSMSGTDAFDHKCGRHAEPSQAAWFVHPKHGEFDRTDFRL